MWMLLTLFACAHRTPVAPADPLPPAREAAVEEDRDQLRDLCRLASYARAAGEDAEAEAALRAVVPRMQAMQADGEFAAIVGAESNKEWKGEPYEKSMAYLMLGYWLLEHGDAGNALAMSKSALLADTGTQQEKWGSDLVAGWVLQALALQRLGDRADAQRALERGVDSAWIKALSEPLGTALRELDLDTSDRRGADAARELLLAGLPAGLTARSRDPVAAVQAATSWATDARQVALDGPKKGWPTAVQGLSRGDIRRSFEEIDALSASWAVAAASLPAEPAERAAADERALREVLAAPLVLVVERGTAPVKLAEGRYHERLRIVPGAPGDAPTIAFDRAPLLPTPLDSVSWQATTRGARGVDSFLAGKAAFKDSALVGGYVLVEAGDVAAATDTDAGNVVALVLYIVGGVAWIAGALTTPAADTRTWDTLPDALWVVPVNAAPGPHVLEVDDRRYTVHLSGAGPEVRWLSALPPGGAPTFGTPCATCPPSSPEPIALPHASETP